MTVLQTWVCQLSFMQQTVLIGAIRAPDGTTKYAPIKPLLRWYRRCVLLSAMDGETITNPYDSRGGSFTGPSYTFLGEGFKEWERHIEPILDDFFSTTDACPIHFYSHFMHGVEIIGYKHPDKRIRDWWYELYIRMVHLFHLFPETEEALDRRLGDNRAQWLERADKATIT